MTHREGGWAKNFSPWMVILFLQVTGPLFPGLGDQTGFCRVDFLWRIISDFCCVFCKSRRYQFVFSPANKMYFICSKENTYPYLARLPLWFLYLLLGEKTLFPPSPVQSRHLYRRLIDRLFIKCFCIFLACGYVDAYPPSSVSCTNAVPYVSHIF